MDLGPTRYREAKRVFVEALDQPASLRAGFVRSACGNDSELQEAVLELLQAHSEYPPELPAEMERIDPAAFRVPGHALSAAIGVGGAGVVFVASREAGGERVAVKIMKPGSAGISDSTRARREADLLRRVEHPGIARILDSGMAETPWGECPFTTLELVDGRELRRAWRSMTLRERLNLLAEVCDAVGAAHGVGVLHRDLKPSNVLVTDDGRVKVIDFGIGKLLNESAGRMSRRTRTGEFLGTLDYASPEQVSGDPRRAGPPTDVFSLGAILFEMVAGRPPHELDDLPLLQAMQLVSTTPAPDLRDVVPDVDPGVAAIARKALSLRSENRYPQVEEMAIDLRRAAAGEPPLHAQVPWLPRWVGVRRVAGLGAAVAVSLALAGILVWGSEGGGKDPAGMVPSGSSAVRPDPPGSEDPVELVDFIADPVDPRRTESIERHVPWDPSMGPQPFPAHWLNGSPSWWPTGDRPSGWWARDDITGSVDGLFRFGGVFSSRGRVIVPPVRLAVAAEARRLGELDRAIREQQELLSDLASGQVQPLAGEVHYEQDVKVRLATCLYFQGDLDAASVLLEATILDVMQGQPPLPWRPGPGIRLRRLMGLHARALAAMERCEEAQNMVRTARESSDPFGPYWTVELELDAAFVAWRCGQKILAESELQRARSWLEVNVATTHPLREEADLMAALVEAMDRR